MKNKKSATEMLLRVQKFNHILFSKKFDGNTTSLFKNATEMAKCLLSNEQSLFFTESTTDEYEKRFLSMKTYLSNFINGKIKKLSPAFVKSLEIIINAALVDTTYTQSILKELQIIHSNEVETFSGLIEEDYMVRLMQRLELCKSQVVFTDIPLELYFSNHAKNLVGRMLDNLFPSDPRLEHKSYEFYVSNETIAYALYERLYNEMLCKLPLEEKVLVTSFIELNNKRLKLYVVNEKFCIFPTIVFNHNTFDSQSGFVYFTENTEIKSIAEMSEDTLCSWYESYYLPAKFSGKIVSFQDYQTVCNNKVTPS